MDHCIFKGQPCVCVNLMFDTHLSCIPDHYRLSVQPCRQVNTNRYLAREERDGWHRYREEEIEQEISLMVILCGRNSAGMHYTNRA